MLRSPTASPQSRWLGVGNVDTKENAHASETNKNKRKRKPLSCFEIWTIGLAGIGILVAAGTGLAIFWQARISAWTLGEIKKGGTDTHDLAVAAKTQSDKMSNMADAADKIRQAAQDLVIQDQRIADNAKESLDASNKQNKAALNATIADFQRDQRAWVGLGQYNIQSFDKQNPFKLVIPFVNSGKSPAISTEEAVSYAIIDHPLTGPPADSAYYFQKTSAVAPQGSYGLTITNTAVPAAYDDITSGVVFLYFFGEFRYHDVYDAKTAHTTSFCLYYDKGLKAMAFCASGNDMN